MLVDDFDVEIVNVYKLCEPSFYIDPRVKVTYLSTNLKPNKEEFKYALKNKKIFSIFIEGIKAVRVLIKKEQLIKQCAKDNDGDIIVSSTLAFDKLFAKYQKNKLLIAWEHCHPECDKELSKKSISGSKKIRLIYSSFKINL